MRRLGVTSLVLASGLLAGCGGGSSASRVPSVPDHKPAPTDTTMTITVPLTGTPTSASQRAPRYVSPGTQYIIVFSAPVGQPLPSGPFQPTTCSPTACSVTIVVPAGLTHFQVGLYDANHLVVSIADFLYDVLPGVANGGTFLLRGYIQLVTFTPVNGSGDLTLNPGVAKRVPLAVALKDSSGAQIIGSTWNGLRVAVNPTTPGITLSSTFMSGLLFEPEKTGLAPAIVDLVYDGRPLPGGTTSVSIGLVNSSLGITAPTFTFSGSPTITASASSGIQPFQQNGTSYFGFVGPATQTAYGVVSSLAQPATVATANAPSGQFTVQVNGGIATFSEQRGPLTRVASNTVSGSLLGLRDRQPPNEPDVVALRASSRARHPAASHRRGTSSFVPPTQVGEVRSFWVEKFNINGSQGTYNNIPFTLGAITQHGWIYFDNTFASGSSPIQYAAQIGQNFDQAWTLDAQTFASPAYGSTAPIVGSFDYSTCDANGTPDNGSATFPVADQSRTVVLIVNPANFGAGVGGFFTTTNFYPQAIANCFLPLGQVRSNEVPLIHVGWFGGGANELANFNVESLAHEFQHLINFVQHSIVRDGGEDAFVNEGLSQVAQDLLQSGLSSQTVSNGKVYLSSPSSYTLTSFSGYENGAYGSGCSGCYGEAYLFVRYLTDRFGVGVLSSLNQSSLAGLSNVRAATGVAPTQILTDFSSALAVSQTGITPATDVVHNYQSLNLRGNNAVGAGGAWTIALSGPAATALTSASPISLSGVYPGSFTFFTLSSAAIGSGSSVKVVDLSGGESLAPLIGSK